MKARCSGWGCSALPKPSMVVTSLSATDHSGVSHDVTARSPTMTLQAPHSPAPQPKCGPVMPSGPRKMSSKDRSGSASTAVSTPLRRNRTLSIEKNLLRLGGEFPDDFRPLHNIAAQEFVEFFRAHRHRNRSLFGPQFYNIRPFYCGIHRGIDLVDDRFRRSRRRHQPEPDRGLISGNAGFAG